jgi:cation:H+ antiporter
MNITVFLWLVLGLALLVGGAELLVRGASQLAVRMGISPLIIGLTVVAYGTSAPELAVSLQSSLTGQADISVGNVVGSNIFNVLAILGLSSAIAPLVVSRQLIRLDVPLMIGVSVLLLFFGLDGRINTSDGIVLFVGAVAYTVFLIIQSRKESSEGQEEAIDLEKIPLNLPPWLFHTGLILVGLGLLVLGANWLVGSAVTIAQALGVSELVIGLTVIAAGTSLPELATSLIASLRGERDLAVGNVVGSNIFNILAVIGLSSAVAPNGIALSPTALRFDIPIMIAVAIACLPIFFTGYKIARWEGILFLGYFIAYTTYLILQSTQHQSLPIFSTILVAFAMPLTVITLVIVTWRAWQERQKNGRSL